jgi:hypothetical protein
MATAIGGGLFCITMPRISYIYVGNLKDSCWQMVAGAGLFLLRAEFCGYFCYMVLDILRVQTLHYYMVLYSAFQA